MDKIPLYYILILHPNEPKFDIGNRSRIEKYVISSDMYPYPHFKDKIHKVKGVK